MEAGAANVTGERQNHTADGEKVKYRPVAEKNESTKITRTRR